MAVMTLTTERPQFSSGLAAIAAALPDVAAPSSSIGQQVEWLMRYRLSLDRKGFRLTVEEEEAADQWECDILRRVEMLPLTQANARIRAMAVLAIHGGDTETIGEDATPCTDMRLVQQVIASLVAH